MLLPRKKVQNLYGGGDDAGVGIPERARLAGPAREDIRGLRCHDQVTLALPDRGRCIFFFSFFLRFEQATFTIHLLWAQGSGAENKKLQICMYEVPYHNFSHPWLQFQRCTALVLTSIIKTLHGMHGIARGIWYLQQPLTNQ